MKTVKILFLLTFGGMLLLSSCDDDLFDITETITFKHEFVVSEQNAVYAETRVVDLTEDSDLIAQYGSKIKSIQVESIRYWLKTHNGPSDQTFSTLNVKVANTDGTDIKSLLQYEDVVLSGLLNNPTDIEMSSEGVSKLESLAETAPHSFSYLFDYAGEDGPYNFTIVIEVRAKMTANPLN